MADLAHNCSGSGTKTLLLSRRLTKRYYSLTRLANMLLTELNAGWKLGHCAVVKNDTVENTGLICLSSRTLHDVLVSCLNIILLQFFSTGTNQMLLLWKVLQSRCERRCCRSEEVQQRPHLQLLSRVWLPHARWASKQASWIFIFLFFFKRGFSLVLHLSYFLATDQIEEASVELETVRDSRDVSLCTLMALVFAEKKKAHPGRAT